MRSWDPFHFFMNATWENSWDTLSGVAPAEEVEAKITVSTTVQKQFSSPKQNNLGKPRRGRNSFTNTRVLNHNIDSTGKLKILPAQNTRKIIVSYYVKSYLGRAKNINNKGLPVRPFFAPIGSMKPFYYSKSKKGNLNSYDIFSRGLTLPSALNLNENQLYYYSSIIKNILKNG